MYTSFQLDEVASQNISRHQRIKSEVEQLHGDRSVAEPF